MHFAIQLFTSRKTKTKIAKDGKNQIPQAKLNLKLKMTNILKQKIKLSVNGV